MAGEDGRLSAENGAKGVIVSNHGGRYLDTTPATIEVLPEVVRAVNGNAEVYLDGGIRQRNRHIQGSGTGRPFRVDGPALVLGPCGGRRGWS